MTLSTIFFKSPHLAAILMEHFRGEELVQEFFYGTDFGDTSPTLMRSYRMLTVYKLQTICPLFLPADTYTQLLSR